MFRSSNTIIELFRFTQITQNWGAALGMTSLNYSASIKATHSKNSRTDKRSKPQKLHTWITDRCRYDFGVNNLTNRPTRIAPQSGELKRYAYLIGYE